MKKIIISIITLLACIDMSYSQDFQTDSYETKNGELKIHFVKHASLFFEYNGIIIHIDPVLQMGDYKNFPDADLILITHHHGDHLDLNAINLIKKENTKIILTQKCHEINENISDVIMMKNGDVLTINGFEIEAVPAYNIEHKRENGEPFHIKGEGNGYVIRFEDKKVYIAGDTENIPEMKSLQDIYIAFLPMNLPYTMTPKMVADAVKAFRPAVVYPYHYGSTDTSIIVDLLKNETDIEVKLKKM